MSLRYFFRTFGCRVNQYETQVIRERALAGPGASAAEHWEGADVCVINTCTVTREADREALSLIRRIARRNPAARLVVTGCLASRDPGAIQREAPAAEVVGNEGKASLPALLGCRSDGGESGVGSFAGHSRAFLKIQDGCNMHCAFCIIPSIRPRLQSKPIAALLAEAEALVDRGYPELVLCGIRLGRYLVQDGDRRVDLPGLLERLAALPGEFRLRLSSLEITDLSDRLIDLVASSRGKICPSFHLPLQSGSETVLRRMGRWYSAAAYERRVGALRERLGAAGLFTDAMVGFPGETEDEFQHTEAFLRRLSFSGLHVFRYSRRPGTPAARLGGQVPEDVLRVRAQALRGLDRELRESFAASALGGRRRVVAGLNHAVGLSEDFLEIHLDRHPGPGLHWVKVTGAARGVVL